MKGVITIILTFSIAFATSMLLDWKFVSESIARTIIIILLIVVEFITGLFVFKEQYRR